MAHLQQNPEQRVVSRENNGVRVVRFKRPATLPNDATYRSMPKPGVSAIEYIVETARPGEVTHIDECDYYSKYLWRSYKEFSTRYSCT